MLPPPNCIDNRLGEGSSSEASDSEAENKNFLFVFNSIVCACRNAAAGRDWFVISKITGLVCNF